MKRLVITCSLAVISVVSLHAQVTFSDGFESGDFSAWDSVNDVQISTAVKHSGTYSAKFTGVGLVYQELIKDIPTSGYVRIEYFVYITSWMQAYAGFSAGSQGGWSWGPWATCGSYVNNCSGQRIGGTSGVCAGVIVPFVHINCPMNQWNDFVLERTSTGNLKGWINDSLYFNLFADSCLTDSIFIRMTAGASSHIAGYVDDISISYVPQVIVFNVPKDWSVVSVPVTVSDYRRTAVYPSAISDAFAFESSVGYVKRDTLKNGPGYWLKFATAQTVTIPGWLRYTETIAVDTGWNIIGSISLPVVVDSIVQSPPGVLTTDFFGYDGTYTPADTLYPGKGYWVKASGPGSLIMSSGTLSRERK
jgi:hypothetical protein